MCVAAFAWQAHPRWLLVAVGNRDEFHERPAAPLGPWDNGILAGRDLKSGGTWLGIDPAGRFALVTNRRGFGEADPARASRGALVTGLLTGADDPSAVPLQPFNPFNLILADREQAHFLSNRPGDIRTHLAHGIYGLSNGALDEPWPKTLQLKGALLDWLNRSSDDFAPLFASLRNEDLADVGVPPREPSDIAREAPETPVFIRDAVYGTRCSTVVAVARDGRGSIIERRFSPQGEDAGETRLEFAW